MQNKNISKCVEAAKMLQQIRLKKFVSIPDGFFTLRDYIRDNKCSEVTARKCIRELDAAGVLVVRNHPVLTEGGKSHLTKIYKIK